MNISTFRNLLAGLSLVLLAPLSALADVEINETNFPDDNFRAYLLAQDYGKDGVITDQEIANTPELYVGNKNIASLEGVQYFTALENLYCSGNLMTSLDVSACTTLAWLECYDNRLTSLDVSGCTALARLECENNQLTSLDVSNCTKLNFLSCSINRLTKLDVSNNTALTRLGCTANQLTSLDVSNCTLLINLSCYNNRIYGAKMDALIASLPNRHGTIYIYHNTAEMERNVCTKAQVAAIREKGWTPYYGAGYWYYEYEGGDDVPDIVIDEKNFPDENFRNWLLEQDYGKDGVITDDEVAGITSIDVCNREISDLEGIRYFTALKELRCANNRLTALDVSDCTALTRLYCCNNTINGVNMDILINSLPNTDGDILLYDSTSETEGNVCAKEQVVALKEKGWTPYYYVKWKWVEYEGRDDPDGIIATEADNGSGIDTNAPAYDLNGRRVEGWQNKKGIYIIGGKKVVVK